MRALEAHRKLPFLAGMHSRRSLSRAGTAAPRIPAQRHLARYPGRGGRGDREREARGFRVEHRQPGHHAAHLYDLAFERRIETVGQQRSGAPARQPESERKTAAGEQKLKDDALPLLLFLRPAAVAALPQQQRRSQSDAYGRHHAVNRLRPERGLRGLQRTAQQDGKGKGRQFGFLQAAGRGFIAGVAAFSRESAWAHHKKRAGRRGSFAGFTSLYSCASSHGQAACVCMVQFLQQISGVPA